MKLRTIFLAAALALAAVACGGSDTVEVPAATANTADDAAAGDTTTSDVTSSGVTSSDATDTASDEDVVVDAQESVDEITESVAEAQAVNGGGSATLTVGDQSWTFDSVLCAIGEEEIGQDGAVFVLSSLQDGIQLYLDITEQFGHSASLSDTSDFENPSVSLDSTGPYTDIILDGTSFTGTGEFLDSTTESAERAPGTFSGTCP